MQFSSSSAIHRSIRSTEKRARLYTTRHSLTHHVTNNHLKSKFYFSNFNFHVPHVRLAAPNLRALNVYTVYPYKLKTKPLGGDADLVWISATLHVYSRVMNGQFDSQNWDPASESRFHSFLFRDTHSRRVVTPRRKRTPTPVKMLTITSAKLVTVRRFFSRNALSRR